MTNKALFYILSGLNVFILFIVIFTDYKTVGSIIGIILLALTFFIGFRIKPDLSKVKKISLGGVNIELSGVEALVFGVLGLYSMVRLTDSIDVIWFYYLLFNLFIMSQAYIKIQKKEVN